jgi:hypothetical protein
MFYKLPAECYVTLDETSDKPQWYFSLISVCICVCGGIAGRPCATVMYLSSTAERKPLFSVQLFKLTRDEVYLSYVSYKKEWAFQVDLWGFEWKVTTESNNNLSSHVSS